MMKCEIIRDLIPLYLDKVCSEDSRKLVEEHLAECSECRKYMKELETELEAVKQKKEEDLDEKRLLQEGAERMKEIGRKSIVDKMIIVDTLLNFLLIVTAVVLCKRQIDIEGADAGYYIAAMVFSFGFIITFFICDCITLVQKWKRRKMTPERREFINGLLEHYQPTDAQDVQEMLKDLLGDTLQGMLEAEMDQKLGYSKYDYQNKETDDSRNGYSHKTVTSSMGDIDLDIPRDRRGEFEPQIVKKHQTDISNIEDQVLSMYAKGMTTRDISTHLSNVYGVDASAEMISHMTDRILPIAKEWQNRPLEKKYAIVFMDAIHFHVREDNRTVKKAVYVAIGIRLSGQKEVLGMWIGGNESAKYWLGVLNEIKNRGVEDIMIVSVDGLTGFVDAIHAVFPLAEIQRCIVHQIRYSTKFISYKDIRAFMKDLKLVYKADTEQLALEALDMLEENWGGKYPSSIASWRNNWPQLSTYFKYPGEIRKLIYTTNSIENFNRQLRKVTKSKTIFPTDDSLFKILYLAMTDITKKWTGKTWDWGQTLDQLCIYFGDRIQPEDLE